MSAQSVAAVGEGGWRSVGSVNTMGRTTVQWDEGGVRVESVQRWSGSRSMNNATPTPPDPS
jgi:hypothetical protein